MKEVGRRFTGHNIFHKVQAAMKMKATRKEFALDGIPSKYFDFEPSLASMLAQHSVQRCLVTTGDLHQVAHSDKD
jgi:hypothetical protein